MLVAITFFPFLMHQKYNVIQGMKFIYCSFLILLSSLGHSAKTRIYNVLQVGGEMLAKERGNAPALESTLETGGQWGELQMCLLALLP